jgi:protein-S-isoprenylcysteine O-methyltransferase Ste14
VIYSFSSGEKMLYGIVWLVFTIILLVFTLAREHPYRFPRFIAFESILSLIFLNYQNWFVAPFSFIQIISWLCLVVSLYLVIHAFYLIKTRGNPAGDFEDTTRLISIGPYRYIRHPLYTSLSLFAFGAFLKEPSWLGAGLTCANVLSVYLTATIEERHNLDRFGEVYKNYTDHTKRFIPFLF